MLKEKKHLRMHPLDLWQSERVYELLRDFFAENFAVASIPKSVAYNFVDTAWKTKQSGDYEAARLACNSIFTTHQNLATRPTENDPLNIIDLSNIKSFADIGANKLGAINFYMRRYPMIEHFYAIDIVPIQSHFHDKSRGTYIKVSSTEEHFPIADQSVDCVYYRFSTHHFEDLKSIRQSFTNAYNLLNNNGFLVLWEETFDDKFDNSIIEKNNQEYGIKTNKEFTERFYNLSEAERWEFIIANDWLMNVNNSHMPWTGQHYSFKEWAQILDECGFAHKQSYNFGLRISGRLKQGVHMCGIFNKK